MRRSGFTLIEILIAMAVFLIGMVSILAVFPVGIKSSTISTDQSVATALAESLDDALTLALRQHDGTSTSDIYFYHDGLGPSGRDFFRLPPMETWDSGIAPAATTYIANGRSKPTWYPWPADADTTNSPAPIQKAPATLASLSGAKGGKISEIVGQAGSLDTKDYPDPLGQYSFRFMCHEYKNPNDPDPDEDPVNQFIDPDGPAGLEAPQPQFQVQNGAQAEVVDKLYTFTLYVYRGWKATQGLDKAKYDVWQQTGATTGVPEVYEWEDQMKHPKKIERFEFNIYAPGAN